MTMDRHKNGNPPKRLLKAARKLKRTPSKDNTLELWRVSKDVLRREFNSGLAHKADVVWNNHLGVCTLGYVAGTSGRQIDLVYSRGKRDIMIQIYRLDRETLELRLMIGSSRRNYDFSSQ